MNILSRDAPWDFRLELSNGREFNLQIAAIADSAHHFELNKREERADRRFERRVGASESGAERVILSCRRGSLDGEPASAGLAILLGSGA